MISDLALSGSEIQGVISFQSYTKDAFDPDFLCWTEDVASLLANLLAVQGLKDQTDTTIDRVRAKANALAHAVTKIEYRSRELQEQALQGMDAPLAHEVFMLARRLGNIPINDLIQEAAENSPSAPGGQMRELLSERERQVADLVYLPNKTIAHQLCLSEHTVAFHLKSIYKKLRVLSKAEAAAVLNQSIA